MEVTLFLLSMCFTLIMGQAPRDFQEVCRTNFRYRGAHDWIPYVNDTSVGVCGDVKWQVLIDQYDYQNLLGASQIPASVWLNRDIDGDGLQFTTGGGVCLSTVQVTSGNSYRNPDANNWVFTQSIDYLDAVEVVVNATVRFTGCIQRATENPPCRNNFVTLHRYDTNSPTVADNQRTDPNNYQPYLGDPVRSRLEQSGGDDTNILRTYLRPQNFNVTYFGIQDTGTYGIVQRILVYYKVAQGYEEGLVICPNVALPPEGSSDINTNNCMCKGNATATASLERRCDENGVCEQNPVCECNPGYQYNETLRACQGCPMGTYKRDVSSTSRCIPCPANTTTISESSTACECIRGTCTIRDPTRPEDPCISIEAFIESVKCPITNSSFGSCPVCEGCPDCESKASQLTATTFLATLIPSVILTALTWCSY